MSAGHGLADEGRAARAERVGGEVEMRELERARAQQVQQRLQLRWFEQRLDRTQQAEPLERGLGEVAEGAQERRAWLDAAVPMATEASSNLL